MANTAEIREILGSVHFYQDRNISSILDIPCGDHYWMKHVTFPSNVQYAGADVSPKIIANNVAAYPNRSFFVADLVEDELDFKIFDNGTAGNNKKTVPDLIFVRALVWHLPIEDNLRLLKRLQNSNARYVMLSTRLRADRNNASFIPAMGKLSRLVLYVLLASFHV